MSPVSKAQMKATAKYVKNNYDELKIRIPKGLRNAVEAFAEAQGQSVNSLVNSLLRVNMGYSEEDWKSAKQTPTQPAETPVKPVTAQGTPSPAAPAHFDQENEFHALRQTHAEAQAAQIGAFRSQTDKVSIRIRFRTLLIMEYKHALSDSYRKDLDEIMLDFKTLEAAAAEGVLPPECQPYYDALKAGAQNAADEIIKLEAEKQNQQAQQDQ